jgi:hypothetical protein
MDYFGLILSIVLLFAGFKLLNAYSAHKNHKLILFSLTFFCYFISSLLWVSDFFELSLNAQINIKNGLDWFQVCGVSFALCGLAVENWEDRPPVARFPYVLAFAPLMLIITYGFVFQTLFLKEVILGIYEAGAITIALLLFILFTVKNGDFLYLTIGLVLILLAFAVYWFPSEMVEANDWVWKLITTFGVLLVVNGYLFAAIKVIEQRKTEA